MVCARALIQSVSLDMAHRNRYMYRTSSHSRMGFDCYEFDNARKAQVILAPRR